MGEDIAGEASFAGAAEVKGRTVWGFGDLDGGRGGMDDEVLAAAHDLLRQVISLEGDGFLGRIGSADLDELFLIVHGDVGVAWGDVHVVQEI